MKLVFICQQKEVRGKESEVAAQISRVIPGARSHLSDGMLCVELPFDVDVSAASEQIRTALMGIGITVRRASEATQYPPINLKGVRAPRTVRLSVYLISLVAVALIVAIVSAVGTGVLLLLSGESSTLGSGEPSSEDYVGKIGLVDAIFKEYSLYDTNGNLLLDEMLRAYVRATGDDYAFYYTAEEYAKLVEENNAQMQGIGISVIEDPETHAILIINVFPESPAEKAGLCPGDLITHVGKGESRVSVAEKGFEAALDLLRGEAGTTLDCTVLRDGVAFDVSVVRAVVQTVSVTGKVSETDPKIGIVKIAQFDLDTPTQFKKAMDDLLAKGCSSFIFDVRNNPGGDLRSISAVLSYFLGEGDIILTTKTKDGTVTEYRVQEVSYQDDYAPCSVKKDEIGIYRSYPKVVLTNGSSASAAELFTAALRDYELATLVGTTTFGKGIYQNIFSLATFGYEGALRLTAGYYSSPLGENYHGKGITPDVLEELNDEAAKKNPYLLSEQEDNQLQKAIAALKPSDQI